MSVTAKWYTNGIKGFINGTHPWKSSGGATFKIALLTNAYTPDQDAHDFLDDVSAYEVSASGSYAAGGAALTTSDPTVDAASNETRMDAADVSWTSFTGTARYAVIYYATGTASTSNLIAYIDFGGDVSATNGTFAIAMAATGVLKITAA